jgi:hypothetical protein
MMIQCARCGKTAPDAHSALLEDWEHDIRTVQEAVSRGRGGDEIAWVCPECLTASERAAIDDEIQEEMTAADRTLVFTPETCARCGVVRTTMAWIDADAVCWGCMTTDEQRSVRLSEGEQ